jgi:SAM-dependent methyltransferase
LEDDNLHLVFDIDLDDNIEERYKYLRKSHPFTKDSSNLDEITTIEELKEKLTAERTRFAAFKSHVEENDIVDSIWYPKAAWSIKGNSLIYDLTRIVTNLNDSSDFDFLINQTEFSIDGFIIQPLDGSTEAKIKPNDQMTVDLLFDGNKWLTREKKQLTNINSKGIKLTKNIWRCYWVNGDWIPREIRWDKKIPNPNHIVDYLTNYNLNRWNVDDVLKFENSYYIKNISDINYDMIKVFQKHRDIQLDIFKKTNCNTNSKWLDIGCGKGNSVKNINYFNPSQYVGFDNDPNCVWESNIRHSSDFHNFTLYDFSKEYDLSQFITTVKINDTFDYIVCNFVIHYAAKSLKSWNRWMEQINIRSKSGTKIFVNFMDFDKLIKASKNNEFCLDDKFSIKLLSSSDLNNDVCTTWADIKFSWVHSDYVKEPVLTKDIILSQFIENQWKLTDEYNLNNYDTDYNTFSSLYTWLTLTKI